MNQWINELLNERINEWMNEWMSRLNVDELIEWTGGWTNAKTDKLMSDKCTDGWADANLENCKNLVYNCSQKCNILKVLISKVKCALAACFWLVSKFDVPVMPNGCVRFFESWSWRNKCVKNNLILTIMDSDKYLPS